MSTLRYLRFALLAPLLVVALWGCDVPNPPPEALTPTVIAPDRVPTAVGSPTAIPAAALAAQGRVWFVRDDRLWVAPIGGQLKQMSQRKITAPPAPSPDGSQVAYLSDRDLVLLDAADGSEKVLTSADMTDRQRLSWSPDGKLLGYFTYDATTLGTEKAWQITVGSGASKELTTMVVRGYPRGPSFERVIRWAPDMRRVVIGSIYGPITLLPLEITAGDATTLNGGEPDWANDGRTLLFTESLTGGLVLYDVVSQDSSPYYNEKRQVGTRLGEFAQAPLPRFDPAGIMFVYRSQVGDERPAVAVRGIGGDEILFVPGNNASWSPYDGWLAYETGNVADSGDGMEWEPDGIAIIDADGSGQLQLAQNAHWPAWGR